MATRGESEFLIAKGVGNTSKEQLVVPTLKDLKECCYISPVFGNVDYLTTPDDLKEDYNSYFNYYDQNAVTSVDLVIEKCENGGFVEKHTIINDTYGAFSPLGNEVHNVWGVDLNYISIKNLNWSKVLDDFGEGTYRIKTNETTIYALEGVQNAFSLTYELKAFTAQRADSTVRFKINNTGVLGDRNDPRNKIVFPNDWEDQLRVIGSFGQDFSEPTDSYTVFADGFEEFTERKRKDKMIFHSDRISEAPRKYFRNELMMANLVSVTNYGRNLANTHIDTPVHGSGEFAPVYHILSKLAGFQVEFMDAYDNQEKLHC